MIKFDVQFFHFLKFDFFSFCFYSFLRNKKTAMSNQLLNNVKLKLLIKSEMAILILHKISVI